jgi:DHA2 family methylenomycin A resistance protein-like MFS transporter
MLPLNFFEDTSFTAPVAVGLAINFTLYGALFVLSLYMQRTLGYSALQTGLAFLLPCVALGVANVFAGKLVTQYGPWRQVS